MKKYQIIYADPPWKYGDRVMNKGHGGRFDSLQLHYSSMTTKEICSLPIKEMCDENCLLFIWTTDSHIPDCLKVISSWGFVYKTVGFYWLKTSPKTGLPSPNLGKWTQKNGELCFLATKGKCSQFIKDRKIHQLIQEPRSKHSKKPLETKRRITKMFGDVPCIELFARQRTPGWDVWGNEVESDIELN